MRQSQNSDIETDAIIAPGEVLELVARLTEQSVGSVPAHEARTLEGLAVETGIPVERLRATLQEMRHPRRLIVPPAAWVAFAALACYGTWLVSHPTPAQIQASPPAVVEEIPQTDDANTVTLDQVSYGPEGGDFQVDDSFKPLATLPEGLSIYATASKLLWGSGDHRAKVIDRPLTATQEETVRANIIELLRYVRVQSEKRRVPLGGRMGGPFPIVPKDRRGISLQASMYFSPAVETVMLPPVGAANDEVAEKIIAKAANDFVENIQSALRQQRDSRRLSGP